MLKIFRSNKNRDSYKFTKKSVSMEDLSDIPNNDLTPFPYKSSLTQALAEMEREFDKKIDKSQGMYLDIENRTMFDKDLQNAKVKSLGILQGQMGVHQRMINEILVNIQKNSQVNEECLNEKLNQQEQIQAKLDEANKRLNEREHGIRPGDYKSNPENYDAIRRME